MSYFPKIAVYLRMKCSPLNLLKNPWDWKMMFLLIFLICPTHWSTCHSRILRSRRHQRHHCRRRNNSDRNHNSSRSSNKTFVSITCQTCSSQVQPHFRKLRRNLPSLYLLRHARLRCNPRLYRHRHRLCYRLRRMPVKVTSRLLQCSREL